jgi:hypothetical protein
MDEVKDIYFLGTFSQERDQRKNSARKMKRPTFWGAT